MKYLGTIKDPKDLITKEYADDKVSGVQTSLTELTARVSTNEDNIAMAESDIEGLQGDVAPLKSDMTAVKSAVTTLQDTYVPNTRKVNGKALSIDITLTASDVGALPTTGGKLTGNLKVGSASLGTNGYVVGTWLQGTASNHLTASATKIAVQDGNGWIYHRTASEILSDIGAVPITSNIIYGEDVVDVEATTPLNADTLQGHKADYFTPQTEFNSLSNVARSGSYNDLSNTPSKEQLRTIYTGTTDPTTSLGVDGDIYIKYSVQVVI